MSKISKAPNLNYVIEPGRHSSIRYKQSRRGTWRKSWFSWLPFKLIRGQFVKLQATILFQTDNWHPLPDSENKDWFDINKLIGINFGLSSPHKNSFRIGYIHDYQNPNEVNYICIIMRMGCVICLLLKNLLLLLKWAFRWN